MKNNYKKLISILCVGFIGVSAFGQGIWKASDADLTTVITAGTAIQTGIFNLTLMHSDTPSTGVVANTDASAPDVTDYIDNTLIWDNKAFIQGKTNGMYFAFKPTISGTIDISIKMGSGKATFLVELADAFATDLTTLTTVTAPVAASTLRTASPIFASASNYNLPQVYDTFNKTTGTWDGSTAIQSTGSNQYLVMSCPVNANKIYVVGCFGSKLMLRGINYTISSAVPQVLADKGISYNGKEITNKNSLPIEVYNVLGKKVATSTTNISVANMQKGVYIVKAVGTDGTLKFSL